MVSFSRVSSVLCFGCHVVSSGSFGCSRVETCWLASLSRDVTGKAPLSSEVVELVILWCYGFGTVLDFFGWFRCESPAGRLPGQPCARWSAQLRVQEHQRVARERRESERAHSRVVLNCPSLDIAHRRLVQSERRYGAEPRLHDILARHLHVAKNNFYPCIKTLIRFTHL